MDWFSPQMQHFLLALFFLICFEFVLIRFHKIKKPRVELSYAFNWSFPGDRPVTFFVLPIAFLFLVNLVLLPKLVFYPIIISFLALVTQVLVEEILFRGMLFGGILKFLEEKKKLTNLNFLIALFGQAFLFMLIHITTSNPIGVFVSGVIFGLVFIVSKKDTLAPTVVHLLGNTIVFFGAYAVSFF
jgi:membrane protease YdiL (CAAX protease family)